MTEQQKREFCRELGKVLIISWWELDEAINSVISVLEKHGFSHRYFETQQAAEIMSDAIARIGDIAHQAVETPNHIDSRQALPLILEIIKSIK
jgi:hypothetical protein